MMCRDGWQELQPDRGCGRGRGRIDVVEARKERGGIKLGGHDARVEIHKSKSNRSSEQPAEQLSLITTRSSSEYQAKRRS